VAVLAAPPLTRAEPTAAALPAVGSAEAADLPGLPHVFRLSGRLLTGGAPEGEAGFRTLRQLGVRTVLSVDGAVPDAASARRFGMRTVHLPFGYDGCPAPTAVRIVRAVRDLPAPIYLHCHHGKHRAPAAAAYARVALDGLTPDQAVTEMQRAGTGMNYVGLYGGVRAFHPPTATELDADPAEFPEATPPPLTRAVMVRIDERFSRLSSARSRTWKPAPNGELQPADEALQLLELLTEFRRTAGEKSRPGRFRRWLADSEREARGLEAALRRGDSAGASRDLDRIGAGCASCHAVFRDPPDAGGR
jgi:hypothetical protein